MIDYAFTVSISWAYFGNMPKKLNFLHQTVVTGRHKWTGYQTSGWSFSDMQLISCNTSFKRCENLILIVANHDFTHILLKFFSGKDILANQTHAIEEGAVPVYIINRTS